MKENFSWDHAAKKYAKLYRRALEINKDAKAGKK
jgi:glycogen synthase